MESLRAGDSAKQQGQGQQAHHLALRQAMSQLVQRPAFLDMLAEELRAVGLC